MANIDEEIGKEQLQEFIEAFMNYGNVGVTLWDMSRVLALFDELREEKMEMEEYLADDSNVYALRKLSKIYWANETAIEIAGATGLEDLVERTETEIQIFEDFRYNMLRMFNGVTYAERKINYVNFAGEEKFLILKSIFPQKSPIYISLTLDVSNYEKAARDKEELTRQMETLQRIDALGRLAAGIAHDINNTLAVITLNTDMIMQAVTTHQDSEVADMILEFATGIRDAVRASNSLTRQLLTFSREQEFRPISLNINSSIQTMRSMIESLLLPNGTDLELQLDNELKSVMVDPSQFGQVMMNLVVNAVDAMALGGKITIETRNTEDGIKLQVKDTGKGMDDETMSRLFEPFFTTKGDSNSGLGLSTVYGIVTQNNGKIDVESLLDMGSTFTIFFPDSDTIPQAEKNEN